MSDDLDVRAVASRRSRASRTGRVTSTGITKPEPTIESIVFGVEWQPRTPADRIV